MNLNLKDPVYDPQNYLTAQIQHGKTLINRRAQSNSNNFRIHELRNEQYTLVLS